MCVCVCVCVKLYASLKKACFCLLVAIHKP